jgi:hypothetical protein
VVFWINAAENTDSLKLMEFISLNLKPLLVISIVPFMHVYLTLNMVVNHRQQAPPSLIFASPLAKLNSQKNRSGDATIFSHLKSTHAFNKKFSSGLE